MDRHDATDHCFEWHRTVDQRPVITDGDHRPVVRNEDNTVEHQGPFEPEPDHVADPQITSTMKNIDPIARRQQRRHARALNGQTAHTTRLAPRVEGRLNQPFVHRHRSASYAHWSARPP
jgi:hypothetical protein